MCNNSFLMHNTHDHVNKLKLKCSCIERPSCCKLLLLAWKILNLSLPPPPEKKKNKRNMWISEYTTHTQYNHIHYMCIDLYICLGWSVATMIFVIRVLQMFGLVRSSHCECMHSALLCIIINYALVSPQQIN